MNTRTTAILALVCVAVFAYLLFVAKPFKQEGKMDKADETEKALLDPKPEGTDRIEVSRRDGKKFVFVREGKEEWNLSEPLKALASKFEVDALLDAVASMKVDKEYAKDNKQRPGPVVSGLDKPLAEIKLYKGDVLQAEVKVGSRVPTGTGNYVQRVGSDSIYVSKVDLTRHFARRLEDYRDKRVLKFEVADVQKVKVEGISNYELVKGAGGTWTVESPVRTRADKTKADGLVKPLGNLRADQFIDDESGLPKLYGLDRPRLKITVDTRKTIPPKAKPGDPDTQPADTQPAVETASYVVMVGGAADPKAESYFAQVSGTPTVFTIRQDTFKSLSLSLAEIRDKAIVHIEADRVRKVEAVTPDGAMSLTQGANGKWRFAEGREADATLVTDLVKAVGGLQAVEFVDPKKELLVLDWEKPRAKVVLTQEGQLTPVTVLVGPSSTSGKMVYVRNTAEEGVAAVSEAAVRQLLQPPVSYRNRNVMTFDKEQVAEIRITPQADMPFPPVRLIPVEGTWSMVEPIKGPADKESVRNLLQDLSSLAAKRVVAAGEQEKTKYGLDQPGIKVAVAMRPLDVATAPADAVAGAASQPAATLPASGPARDVAVLKQLLDYQKTNPDENPQATAMLKEMLAAKQASQPAGDGASAPVGVVHELHLAISEGQAYACVANDDAIYELDMKVFDDATAEMYDRQVLKFDAADVTEVAFKGRAGSVTLSRAGDDWKYLEDTLVRIDPLKVTDVLNAFKDLKTHRYADYNAADPAKYGLTGDLDRVAFRFKDGRQVEIAVSEMAPASDASKTSRYAMITGTSKVFQLRAEQVGRFRQRIEDFQRK